MIPILKEKKSSKAYRINSPRITPLEHKEGILKSTKNITKEIPYQIFEFIILKSQLTTHFNYLNNLRRFFRKFDVHKYGYINRQQFLNLLDLIDNNHQIDTDILLDKIDPHNSDIIIFNQIVLLFQNEEIVNQNEEIINLLQLCYSL